MILSRWPIRNGEGEQRLFGTTCKGEDCLSDKGVMYVRIDKKGMYYHIFGTHVQADAGLPGGQMASAREVRKSQFGIIRKFIDGMKIGADEPVVVAGDLNVDKHGKPGEFHEMLAILDAEMPDSVGHRYSFDGRLNDLSGSGREQMLLDYVLYSKRHRKPVRGASPSNPISFNRVMFYRSDSEWREFPTESYRWDISDHYPVVGLLAFSRPTGEAGRSVTPKPNPPVPRRGR